MGTNNSQIMLIGLLIKALMIFTVFPVREYARNLAAVKFGDDTPALEGKLTLNPFAHLDPFGCVFMLITGFGWGKGASINPSKYKVKNKRLAHVVVSLAGPLANLLIAFAIVIIMRILSKTNTMNSTINEILSMVALLNVSLAVFHLIPVPGFDGGNIIMLFLPPKAAFAVMRYQQYIFIGMMLLIFIGPLNSVISVIVSSILNLMLAATSFLG